MGFTLSPSSADPPDGYRPGHAQDERSGSCGEDQRHTSGNEANIHVGLFEQSAGESAERGSGTLVLAKTIPIDSSGAVHPGGIGCGEARLGSRS